MLPRTSLIVQGSCPSAVNLVPGGCQAVSLPRALAPTSTVPKKPLYHIPSSPPSAPPLSPTVTAPAAADHHPTTLAAVTTLPLQ